MQVKDTNRNRRNIGVLAAVCLVLQLAVAPNIALGNGRANVAYVLASLVALMIGGRDGVVTGFVAGLVFDLSSTGPIGLMALLLTGSSFLLGIEVRDRLVDDPVGSLALASLGALAVSLAYHLALLLLGASSSLLDVLVLRTLPTALLTIVCYLPFALVLSRRGGGGGGRHVGRYTIGGR